MHLPLLHADEKHGYLKILVSLLDFQKLASEINHWSLPRPAVKGPQLA
jgi:hypothetical protein